jgi:hypothetical protein
VLEIRKRASDEDILALLMRELGISKEVAMLVLESIQGNELTTQTLRGTSFPERIIEDVDLRKRRVLETIRSAPDISFETRERNLRVTNPEIDPSTVLRDLYTNDEGQMVCQMCKYGMNLRRRDRRYYFEAVEVLRHSYLQKEDAAQYIALCPECAAVYRNRIKNNEDWMNEIRDSLLADFDYHSPETIVNLPDEIANERITAPAISFVATHRLDLQTILRYYENSQAVENPGGHNA